MPEAKGEDLAGTGDAATGASDAAARRDKSRPGRSWQHVLFQFAILLLVIVGGPLLCRRGLSSPARAVVVFVSVLLLNVAEVMPIYCTSLFIPVLGTLCQVLGQEHGTVSTSTLLVGKFFNHVSFMVLGALVINGIFVKCSLEKRLMNLMLAGLEPSSPLFLLLLLLGGMAACSVLFSGSLVLLSALEPVMKHSSGDRLSAGVVKRLLLGVAYASNAGSTWFPISSPVNLITIALLDEFDSRISLSHWVAVSIPVSVLAMLGVWIVLLLCYPREADVVDEQGQSPSHAGFVTEPDEIGNELTLQHYLFLFLGCMAVLAITVYATELEPLVGHAAIISLSLVVVVFGSGFMTESDFRQLDWDLLAVVGGTNVMAFIVRETGLAALVATQLVRSEFFISMSFWTILACLICGTMIISTLSGHTLTGVLVLPLVVAVGVKLQAAEMTAMLVAISVPLGMAMPHSSFDNQLSFKASTKLNRKDCELVQKDFRCSGGILTIWSAILLLSMGYYICLDNYGLPPPVVVAETGTPKRLKPKVITENLPSETSDISWNRHMSNWTEFKKRPDYKAFAVGKMEPGMKTRAWSATWNHPSQKAANEQALKDCEKLAKECRVIYPTRQAGHGIGHELNVTEPSSEQASNHVESLSHHRGSDFLERPPPAVDMLSIRLESPFRRGVVAKHAAHFRPA